MVCRCYAFLSTRKLVNQTFVDPGSTRGEYLSTRIFVAPNIRGTKYSWNQIFVDPNIRRPQIFIDFEYSST
jgi:hypothetical protein